MPEVLNLSNEVVKLRAEVKRVKVLLIRKLIRQISGLEKKKGNAEDLERNRRRAARLREEIHELKVIAPDKVTKAALQKDISFEKVCRDKDASLSDRAAARIATHQQFSKKIESIKEAVKAFKEERINTRKAEKLAKNNAENSTLQEQQQEPSDDEDDDEGSEKPHDDDVEEKVSEDEGDNMTDKPPHEETWDSSQESQKTRLETSNEETSQYSETHISEIQEQPSVPEEVIRMRKEVKRTRVLVISKLTQQVAALKKKKKGDESEAKERRELIAGLVKDIQGLRSLKPNQLTITALQENTELEKVLMDPQVSLQDRAVARIVTHSRFVNKLKKVKEAIEEERVKDEKARQRKIDREALVQSKKKREDDDIKEDVKDHSDDEDDEEDVKEESDEDDDDEEDVKKESDEDDDDVLEAEKKPDTHSHVKEMKSPEKTREPEVKSQNADAAVSKFSPVEILAAHGTELPKSITKPDKESVKPRIKEQPQPLKEDEESDLSDDEEKEYFDDSTEERFHKQSSHSDESGDDDFFVGKVSKFKKKRKNTQAEAETQKPAEKAASELRSAFCSTLSTSGNPKRGSRRDRSRPPRFRNQKRDPEGGTKASLYKDSGADRKAAPFKPNRQTFKLAGQRRGGPPGTSRLEQRPDPRGPSGKISNPPQQSLHPSWEASRKRKEQQGQITAFQGKKIKFDDD